MTTINFRSWELIADKQLTALTYDQVTIGGADSCICNECKNFANYRDNLYPDEIRQLFNDLGIDYKKESEICHYCRQDNGQHYYGGWFHYKGEFKGKNCTNWTTENSYTFDLTPISETFNIGFRVCSDLTFFDDKDNLVQIEFEVKIPWTIDKELESE